MSADRGSEDLQAIQERWLDTPAEADLLFPSLEDVREREENMSDRCGYKWDAPYIPPPGGRMKIRGSHNDYPAPTKLPQECVLFAGHRGPHRSMTNVIAENTSEASS